MFLGETHWEETKEDFAIIDDETPWNDVGHLLITHYLDLEVYDTKLENDDFCLVADEVAVFVVVVECFFYSFLACLFTQVLSAF